MQSTFMNKIDEKDKKLIEEYLQSNRKSGKTDQQIIKQASTQATLFMTIIFIVIITMGVFLAILYGVDFGQAKDSLIQVLGKFFPKITAAATSTTNDL